MSFFAAIATTAIVAGTANSIFNKPSQPAAPDYAGAATAQGQANIDAARLSARLSNPNIISPYGNQTVTFGGAPTFDQSGYDAAMSAYQNQQGNSYQNSGFDEFGNPVSGYNAPMPTREQFTSVSNPDQPTVTQTLTPAAQEALTNAQAVQKGLSQVGITALGNVQDTMSKPFESGVADFQTSMGNQGPVDYGPSTGQYGYAGSVSPTAYGQAGSVGADQYGLAQGGVAGPNLQTSFGGYGDVQNAPTGEQYGQAGSVNAGSYGQAGSVNASQFGGLMTGADMSGVARMPINAGMTAQQAIMSRLGPQIEAQRASTMQSLRNQGVTEGSEAYNNAMRQQQQGESDLLTQAQLQGLNLDLAANQQGYGQAMGQAGLYNAALGQGFGQASQAQQMQNQAISQNFGQGVTAQQLANQAIGQNFGQGMQSNAAQNAAQAQRYSQAAGNAGFNNAAQLSQFQSNLANQQAGNQAIAQNYGQGMSSQQLQNQAIGQNYGQGVTSQNQANAAIGQNYGQGLQSAGLYNQAQNQKYNQALQSAQFGNTALGQQYQRNLGEYNLPLNTMTALQSGSQIQNPQFQQYTGQTIAPAPIANATTLAGNYAQNQYGQNVAANNATTQGLFSIGGSALSGGIGKGGLFGAPATPATT